MGKCLQDLLKDFFEVVPRVDLVGLEAARGRLVHCAPVARSVVEDAPIVNSDNARVLESSHRYDFGGKGATQEVIVGGEFCNFERDGSSGKHVMSGEHLTHASLTEFFAEFKCAKVHSVL